MNAALFPLSRPKSKKAVMLLLCWELVTQFPKCSGALLHLKTIRNDLWRKTSVHVFQMLMHVLIFYDSAICLCFNCYVCLVANCSVVSYSCPRHI